MKTILLTAVMMLMTIQAVAAGGPGQGGSGGGGLYKDGRYMTFFSAGLSVGFYAEPNELSVEEVPGLKETIDFFEKTPYLSRLTAAQYAANLAPSSGRHYYRVHADTFTPEVRNSLIAAFASAMNISDSSHLALFAVTDTSKKTTSLLPEFFTLSEEEQKAILFHEVFWILNPKAEYKTVIDAEMAFQAYLHDPSSARLVAWLKTAGQIRDVLDATINVDLGTGVINDLLDQGTMKISTLFGTEFLDCVRSQSGQTCSAFIQTHIYDLSQKYPQSLFIALIADEVNNGKLSWIYDAACLHEDLLSSEWQPRAVSDVESAYLILSSPAYSPDALLTLQMKVTEGWAKSSILLQ